MKPETKEALLQNKKYAREYIPRIKKDQDELIKMLKTGHKKKISKIKETYLAQKKAAQTPEELKSALFNYKSALADAKNRFISTVDTAKSVKNQAYIDYVQKNRMIRNGKTNLKENIILAFQTFINSFHLSKFLLNNVLYLTIIVFFI